MVSKKVVSVSRIEKDSLAFVDGVPYRKVFGWVLNALGDSMRMA